MLLKRKGFGLISSRFKRLKDFNIAVRCFLAWSSAVKWGMVEPPLWPVGNRSFTLRLLIRSAAFQPGQFG